MKARCYEIRYSLDLSKDFASTLGLASVIQIFNTNYSITKFDRNKSSIFVSIEGYSI